VFWCFGVWVFFGFGDFVDDIGFEEFKVQLFLPSRVEGETEYLAFDFAVFGSVPVNLETSSSKFNDVIAKFEFVGEFSEMISEWWTGFVGFAGEDDGIRVKVEDLLGTESAESRGWSLDTSWKESPSWRTVSPTCLRRSHSHSQ